MPFVRVGTCTAQLHAAEGSAWRHVATISLRKAWNFFSPFIRMGSRGTFVLCTETPAPKKQGDIAIS